MTVDCFMEKVVHVVLMPFKVIWFLFVTFLIGAAFVAWWGFVFGSVIAAVLMLIFAPELFLLPLGISVLYVPLVASTDSVCEEKKIKTIETKIKDGKIDKSTDMWDNFLKHLLLYDRDIGLNVVACYNFLYEKDDVFVVERVDNRYMEIEDLWEDRLFLLYPEKDLEIIEAEKENE